MKLNNQTKKEEYREILHRPIQKEIKSWRKIYIPKEGNPMQKECNTSQSYIYKGIRKP